MRPPRVTASRLVLLLGIGVAAALLSTQIWPLSAGAPRAFAARAMARSDFGAFYCAARVARAGRDPYALAPLRECESEYVYEPGGLSYARVGIDPAPLPPYALAAFVPLTFLSYRDAALAWLLLLVAATLAGAEALRRLTTLPYCITLAMLAFAGGTVCFTFGQTGALVTLSLTCVALLLRRGWPRAAVAASLPMLLEPHLALPVLLALFVWTRARFAVAASIVAAGLVSLAFGGRAENVEYALRVLPTHAFAEVPVHFQYSLTAILYLLRVPDSAALRIAALQYALMVALGVALAGPLARRIGAPALVLFPAACAVLGGTFIHISQIASALPFALYLAGSVPQVSAAGWLAAALIALPWPAYGYDKQLILTDALVIVAATVAALRRSSPGVRAGVAVAALALYAATPRLFAALPREQVRPPEPPSAVAAGHFERRLASTEWALQARAPVFEDSAPRWIAYRIPAWVGLLVVFGAGLTVLRKRRTP